MEYLNKYNTAYINILNRPVVTYTSKVLALTHYESPFMDLSVDCIFSESSVTIENQQGVRRRCTLRFADKEKKYIPNPNGVFWYNRKLKVYKGVVALNGDIYWWSQGVFIVTNFDYQDGELTVECSDKYAMLNGEVKLGLYDGEIQIPDVNSMEVLSEETRKAGKGLKISNIIRDFLIAEMGNNLPLDPITPIIDPEFANQFLDYQIVCNKDSYPADVIANLATGYGFNTYYDTDGNFRVTSKISDEYYHIAPVWIFDDHVYGVSNGSMNINLTESVNAQKVSGVDIEGKVYSYTAKNMNANSPINISLVGQRDAEEIEIENGNSIYKCQQKAEYELKRATLHSLEVPFESHAIPHIDVDVPIVINNEELEFRYTKFIVTSVTMPLGSESMSVSCTNVNYLPMENISMSKM